MKEFIMKEFIMKRLNSIADKLILFCEHCESRDKARLESKIRSWCRQHRIGVVIALQLFKLCILISCIDILFLPISFSVRLIILSFYGILGIYAAYRAENVINDVKSRK